MKNVYNYGSWIRFLGPVEYPPVHFTPRVLYEDPSMGVIYKPPGMHTVNISSGETQTLVNWMKRNKIGNYYLKECGLLSRLDKQTSGIIIFSKMEQNLNYMQKTGKIFQSDENTDEAQEKVFTYEELEKNYQANLDSTKITSLSLQASQRNTLKANTTIKTTPPPTTTTSESSSKSSFSASSPLPSRIDLEKYYIAFSRIQDIHQIPNSLFSQWYLEPSPQEWTGIISDLPVGYFNPQSPPISVVLSTPFVKSGIRGFCVRLGSQVRRGMPYSASCIEILGRLEENIIVSRVSFNRGFRHQIRAHLASLGLPLVGENIYHDPINVFKKSRDTPDDRFLGLYCVSQMVVHSELGITTFTHNEPILNIFGKKSYLSGQNVKICT